jgi:hypothetical protein
VIDMPAGSSPKRERQYEHIVDSEKQRGVPTKRAKQIAARTVNKQRARSGEARKSSRLSKSDSSSQQRAQYRRSHGGSGRTRDQLYAEARSQNIRGRSRMNKAQLERALR